MSAELVQRYLNGADAPARAIEGLRAPQLNAPSPKGAPGTWTLQQNIVHLMDSDLIGSDRMKRIAAMPNPLLIGYDETAFIDSLTPEALDVGVCAEIFRMNRVLTAEVLRRLPAQAWERTGVHNEAGKKTLRDLVKGYCDHLDHHLAIMAAKRRLITGG